MAWKTGWAFFSYKVVLHTHDSPEGGELAQAGRLCSGYRYSWPNGGPIVRERLTQRNPKFGPSHPAGLINFGREKGTVKID